MQGPFGCQCVVVRSAATRLRPREIPKTARARCGAAAAILGAPQITELCFRSHSACRNSRSYRCAVRVAFVMLPKCNARPRTAGGIGDGAERASPSARSAHLVHQARGGGSFILLHGA